MSSPGRPGTVLPSGVRVRAESSRLFRFLDPEGNSLGLYNGSTGWTEATPPPRPGLLRAAIAEWRAVNGDAPLPAAEETHPGTLPDLPGTEYLTSSGLTLVRVPGGWEERPPELCAGGHPLDLDLRISVPCACGSGRGRHALFLCTCGEENPHPPCLDRGARVGTPRNPLPREPR